jgi:hypothetical protein
MGLDVKLLRDKSRGLDRVLGADEDADGERGGWVDMALLRRLLGNAR